MEISAEKIRSYRLRVHHLDKKLPMDKMTEAAGVCGLQNTPPGSWETSLYNRLAGCTLQALQDALYKDKTLLQAWSFRGVPAVFPTNQSDVFLTPLIAREGEWPWVYTLGITGVLDHMQMPFDDLLARVKKAAAYLDGHTVTSKEALDQTLADIVLKNLPGDKRDPWCAPSIYGNPDKQTMGGAAVSFLLRPCSFYSLVVFGQRQDISPTFTSFQNWTGHAPKRVPGAEKALVRKFLHAYGPATVDYFMTWLGCSPRQAKRLWGGLSDEMEPVQVEGKTCYILSADWEALLAAESDAQALVLLGAHDPYLDLKDRTVILEDKARHKAIWKYVGNPGAVLKGGRVIGTWKGKTLKDKLDVTISLWEAASASEQKKLEALAGQYAAFRQLHLRNCTTEAI